MTIRPGPLAPSLTVRRTLFAILVAGMATVILGGVIGFAAAGDGQASASGAPHELELPTPNEGDRGVYTVTVVRPNGDAVDIVTPEKEYARFEWLGDRTIRDAEGNLRHAHVLHYQFQSKCGSGDTCTQDMLVFYDAVTGDYLAHYKPMRIQGGETPRSGWSGSPAMFTYAKDDEWRPLLLCGVQNVFQGHAQSLAHDLVPFTNCQVDAFWVSGLWYRAVSTEVVGGYDAVAFTQVPRGYQGAGGGGDSHFWVSPAIPYVLKIAVQFQEKGLEDQYLVFRLLEFERGARPLSHETVPPQPLPPMRHAPRQPWGPDDSGVDHPFPLSAAFTRARDEPERPALRDFLAAHPDAYTALARYSVDIDGSQTRRLWTIYVTNGDEGVAVCPEQIVKPQAPWWVPISPTGNVTEYSYRNCNVGGHYPAPELVPTEVLAVDSFQARWDAYAPPELQGREANGWDYQVHCNHGGCTAAEVEAGPSLSEHSHTWNGTWPLDTDENTQNFQCRLLFDQSGRAAQSEVIQVKSGTKPSNETWSGGGPSHEAIQASALKIEAWVFPTGRYAVATGGLALLAGLVYWLWPSLKLSFVGLFSRVQRDSALDQATRASLHALVEANPGIHFQEIVRRSGKGRSTVEHHLRKLVNVGLLVRQDAPGYACFFPKGSTDRRLMAATPVLKSEGARTILRAVAMRPGASGLEICAATGLDRGTVSYHVSRLAEAALVTAERAGRELRVGATDLGRAALASEAAKGS